MPRVQRYTKEQIVTALSLYNKLKSMPKVVELLGYPSVTMLWNWKRMYPEITASHKHRKHRKWIRASIDIKLNAIRRCIDNGEMVKSIAEDIGYSSAWLHHKGRNKHHYEYWIDYNTRGEIAGEDVLIPVEMPDRYLAEMIMDRIAASKVYKGKDYTDSAALEYFLGGIEMVPMHPNTKKSLYRYLRILAKYGEEKTFKLIRQELVLGKKISRTEKTIKEPEQAENEE